MFWARFKQSKPNAKAFLVCSLLVVAVLVWKFSTILLFANVGHLQGSRPCPRLNEKIDTELVARVGFDVSRILTELGVDHALCYESLLAALKYGRMLSRQDHIDLCIMNTHKAKVSSGLAETLSQDGLNMQYDLWRGEFSISETSRPSRPLVVITVFYKTFRGKVCRAGISRWIRSFFNSDSLDAFPQNLLEGPLNNMTFEDKRMPVPKEDSKMLIFLYPNTWWLDHDPLDCSDSSKQPL
ncbi:B0416.7 protein [Elysia marginata]|uniref:B0416.7 protein n=1 Tax=Elysia marginata TaxID=1093978 RepID=A0AAV4GK84_9GAST|nr:B0416.7 protein [Elysia marginata]